MDALLKSFVDKVHVHATVPSDESHENGDCIARHLIPVLTSTATIDVKSKALCTLSFLKYDDAAARAIRNDGGILGTLKFMLSNAPEKVSSDCILHACDVLSVADADFLQQTMSTLTLEPPMPVVLNWCSSLPCNRPNNLLAFVSLCAENEDLLKELKKHNPIEWINDYVTAWKDSFKPEEILFAIKSSFVLFGSSGFMFKRWWRGSGSFLMDAFCRYSLDHPRRMTPVIEIIYIFTSHLPWTTIIPLTTRMLDALSEEISDAAAVSKMISILHNESVLSRCIQHDILTSILFARGTEGFLAMNLPGRQDFCDYMVRAAYDRKNTQKMATKEMFDTLYRVNDAPTRTKRALLYALGVERESICSNFSNLLMDNHDASSHLDCVTNLDSLLCEHFEFIAANPQCVTGDVMICGHPPHLLFHCIEDLIGKAPLDKTLTGVCIRKFLRNSIVDIQNNGNNTHGTLLYLSHIKNIYGIHNVRWVDPPPRDRMMGSTCPITLEVMHCPVVASDGNTYDIRGILCLLRQTNPRSPLTRKPLERSVIFNRSLQHFEEHMSREKFLRCAQSEC